MQLLADGADTKVNALVEQVMGSDTQLRGFSGGACGPTEHPAPPRPPRHRPLHLEGYAPLITCPTLVLDGEIDLFFGQPSQLYEALRCQKTYHLFPAAEGGGEHCQEGAVSRLHQVVFDWLDTVLATPSRPKS